MTAPAARRPATAADAGPVENARSLEGQVTTGHWAVVRALIAECERLQSGSVRTLTAHNDGGDLVVSVDGECVAPAPTPAPADGSVTGLGVGWRWSQGLGGGHSLSTADGSLAAYVFTFHDAASGVVADMYVYPGNGRNGERIGSCTGDLATDKRACENALRERGWYGLSPLPAEPAADPEAAKLDGPRVHDLKCWPALMPVLLSGDKTFEIRRNDRGFRVGDTLHLRGWDDNTKQYTGDMLAREVTHILSAFPAGLKDGYVILSLAPPRSPLPAPAPPTGDAAEVAKCAWPIGTRVVFAGHSCRTMRLPRLEYGQWVVSIGRDEDEEAQTVALSHCTLAPEPAAERDDPHGLGSEWVNTDCDDPERWDHTSGARILRDASGEWFGMFGPGKFAHDGYVTTAREAAALALGQPAATARREVDEHALRRAWDESIRKNEGYCAGTVAMLREYHRQTTGTGGE